jgi:hypothetical protein
MEIAFGYTREDWVEIDARYYRKWLFDQRPLVGTEFAICWAFLVFSVAAGLGLVGFLGVAVWEGLAWYWVVGAAALLVFVTGTFLEVMRPRREPVRGLMDELAFRMNLVDQLLAKAKARRAEHFRREEERGALVLTHRYWLRLDPEGLTLTTEYPPNPGTASRQDIRTGWDAVSAIHLDDHLLSFAFADGQFLFVPRSAFADEDACGRFLRAAEAYRTAPPPPDTRIQAQAGVCPGVSAGHICAARTE